MDTYVVRPRNELYTIPADDVMSTFEETGAAGVVVGADSWIVVAGLERGISVGRKGESACAQDGEKNKCYMHLNEKVRKLWW